MTNTAEPNASSIWRCCAQSRARQSGSENSTKDTIMMLLCYLAFWSFLIGFSALLLKGAIDSDVNHTLLWAFYVIGLLFVSFVTGAIKIGTDAVEKVKIAERQAATIAKMRIELEP
mmetsp:Transcript_743/g.822  ORF Transcript_743/g.822 Transcript_743/m.822 type:complete len:116 (-) Transcript_743:364-711(-)